MNRITLLIFALLVNISLGQNQPTKLRFLAFPQKVNPEPIELLVEEGVTIEVDTPGHELTKPYPVPPISTITVGKTVEDQNGKAIFQIYGQALAPTASEQIILLLRKGIEDRDGFIVLPIAAEMSNFRGGSFMFINAAQIGIRGVVGDQKIEIRPGQIKTLNPKPDFDGNICQVTLAYQRDEDFKKFYDTRWPANPQSRALVIIYQNPQTGRIGLAPITDIISRN